MSGLKIKSSGFQTFKKRFDLPALFMGFAFALFGGLVLAYVLVRYLAQGSAVPGFAFLASIIAVFSGGQLLALGIIGEHLARMHFRALERPARAVRKPAACSIGLSYNRVTL